MTAAMVLEDTHEQWREDAVATIIGLAHALETFTAEDLAREMRPAPHPNSPGQAFAAARTPATSKVSATPPAAARPASTASRESGAARSTAHWANSKI